MRMSMAWEKIHIKVFAGNCDPHTSPFSQGLACKPWGCAQTQCNPHTSYFCGDLHVHIRDYRPPPCKLFFTGVCMEVLWVVHNPMQSLFQRGMNACLGIACKPHVPPIRTSFHRVLHAIPHGQSRALSELIYYKGCRHNDFMYILKPL